MIISNNNYCYFFINYILICIYIYYVYIYTYQLLIDYLMFFDVFLEVSEVTTCGFSSAEKKKKNSIKLCGQSRFHLGPSTNFAKKGFA